MEQFQPVKDRPESSWIEWRSLMLLLFPEYDFSSSLKPPSKSNTWNSFRNPIFYKAPWDVAGLLGLGAFKFWNLLMNIVCHVVLNPKFQKIRKAPRAPKASTTHWRWGLFGSWMATIGFTPERSNLSCSASRRKDVSGRHEQHTKIFCCEWVALTMQSF